MILLGYVCAFYIRALDVFQPMFPTRKAAKFVYLIETFSYLSNDGINNFSEIQSSLCMNLLRS